jgi:hypothetical protein
MRLGASFFFSRGGGDAGTAEKFVTSIARQLASRSPPLHEYICESVRQQRDIAKLSLNDQWHQLVLQPLSRLDGGSYQPPYLLVVDALDECEGEDHIGTIVRLLAEARFLKSTPLRIFITSRPEIPIRHGFEDMPDDKHQYFVLHNIPLEIVNQDISIFLIHEFTLLAKTHRLGSDWQGEETVQILVQKAGGLFVWAATAYRFVHEKKLLASRRLSMLLRNDSSGTEPEGKLDEIYLTVLANSVSSSFKDEEKSFIYSTIRLVLGSLAILFSPLSTTSLSALLDIEKEVVDNALEDLRAILVVPENPDHTLRLHHPSLRDFLLDKKRCTNLNLYVDEKQAHSTLTDRCIQLMSTALRYGVYCWDDPGVLVRDMERSQVEQYLPLEVQYACLYWVQHLQKSDARIHDHDQVDQFLQAHLLHWFEALSWMQKINEGILAIISLESIASVSLF